jgi:hypothetical protein
MKDMLESGEKTATEKTGASIAADSSVAEGSERGVAVFVLLEIVHVLEILFAFIPYATNILSTAAADPIVAHVAWGFLLRSAVVVIRANAIVGHGFSFPPD